MGCSISKPSALGLRFLKGSHPCFPVAPRRPPRPSVNPRPGVRMWSSRRWRVSRRASPFLSLSHPSTCAWVRRLNSRMITYILACNTVSFGLDDVLFTAASDSEDFGPALTDSLPPSGQEVWPSAAYSELVDVLLHATEKLSIDWPDRPSASAPPSCPWPSGQDEESDLRNLRRQGQNVQTFLPASNILSSLRSVTPTPWGLVCKKSSSAPASFSVAVRRRIRLSPPTTRSFSASGPRDRRHSRFSSTAYGPHTGHFLVRCLALHRPEQGRQRLSFMVEDVTSSRHSGHSNTCMPHYNTPLHLLHFFHEW